MWGGVLPVNALAVDAKNCYYNEVTKKLFVQSSVLPEGTWEAPFEANYYCLWFDGIVFNYKILSIKIAKSLTGIADAKQVSNKSTVGSLFLFLDAPVVVNISGSGPGGGDNGDEWD